MGGSLGNEGGRRRLAVQARRGRAAKEEAAARIVDCLRQLFKAIQEHSKAILGRTGMSGPQVWALTILDREPDLSLGELATRLFAHPSTVSGIVDRLEARGAVRRVTDPEDARGIRLSLTPKGRRLLRKSPPPFQHGLRLALAELSAARLRSLRRSLEEVVKATAADEVVAPFFEVEALRRRKR
jgi:MarR family transcriptional regulator, organic hydroperoxide resistance regulator